MELSILIVDDSAAMRTFIIRVLGLSGLPLEQCLEAGDGEEALQVLKNNRIDAVLTDINMPRMNGEEFLRRIAAHPTLCLIPVVVVSTDRTESRRQRMLALGAKSYVTKPFAPEVLRDTLERTLTGAFNGAE